MDSCDINFWFLDSSFKTAISRPQTRSSSPSWFEQSESILSLIMHQL